MDLRDIALIDFGTCIDIDILNSDLTTDKGLETAMLISLFTDRRVTSEQLPELETDRKGWWGDMYSKVENDKIGSRLWTLLRAKRTTETLRLFEDYCREATNWLLEDGVVETITVTASYDSNGHLIGDIRVTRPSENETRFSLVWDEQKLKRG